MAKIQQRLLTGVLAVVLGVPGLLAARRFYPDDPIERVPPPVRIDHAETRKLNDIYDYFLNTFGKPGEKSTQSHPISAQDINTVGEVPDSGWYTNRHAHRRMTIEELVRGPGNDKAPAMDRPWTVSGGKTEGIMPGLTIKDARGRTYLLKFDPATNPELASAADVVGSKFIYALGYNVPENYIVYFTHQQLTVGPNAKFTDQTGRERRMKMRDVEDVLHRVKPDRQGRYRAMASLYISGKLLGPFRYYGIRRDDPNDIVPHENRRDLRGLFVFAAWLNHTDAKSLNSLDSLVEEKGLKYIKHYLIDFGAILGSDSFEAKSPRAGNVSLFDWTHSAEQFFSLGLYVPAWMRANYPHIPSAGHFEYRTFNPEKWHPNYYNSAFANRLPDDEFWAARQVMAFTDAEILALVKIGQYSDPAAVDWITRCLIERRNKIGAEYLAKVLPVDHFRVTGDRLEFDDLAVRYRFMSLHGYVVRWSRFDNETGRKTPLGKRDSLNLPPETRSASPGEYFGADIQAGDPPKSVTAYIRKERAGYRVVGLDRHWRIEPVAPAPEALSEADRRR